MVHSLLLTPSQIGILPILKTYRLPTPLVVLQLALIPGSFLIGFLLSPLLVLSRNISQKPLHRLRWPEQKEMHRRILSFSFYILCAVLEVSLVGMWLVWVLNWKNPFELVKEIMWNDGRYVSRLCLVGYWIALVAVSLLGWVKQLSLVRNPIQFKHIHTPDARVDSGEMVKRLVSAANKTAAGMTLNGRRKYFHLLLAAIIVPGVVVDVSMVCHIVLTKTLIHSSHLSPISLRVSHLGYSYSSNICDISHYTHFQPRYTSL